MDTKFAAKLREIIDQHEIWQVLQRYGRGLDRLDRELVRSCYFDDAIDDHGKFIGNADSFIEWANQVSLSFASTQHAVTNHSCEIDGDDAYAETYYLFTGISAEGPHLMSTGRYIDHFQRRNGEWRIANRITIVEGNIELSETLSERWQPPDYGLGEVNPATRDRNDVSYHRPPIPRQPTRSS